MTELPGLIDKVFPLPARFRQTLPRDISELSRLLTSGRTDRSGSYLGKPALLSAYLRYFLPWNIYRLCRLFSFLPLDLKPHDAVTDLGAGPLTLALSLWISRPDLRAVPLEFRCLDKTAAVLDAGKKLFAALCEETKSRDCRWTIRTIRGDIRHNSALSKGKPAALTAAVNVYNELFWDFSPSDTRELERFTGRQARQLSFLTENSGSILVVEPGIPRSGEFISLLRSGLIKEGRIPLLPCTHSGPCPLPGGRAGFGKATGKAKWCHFAFDTEDAPRALHKLSAAARLPKERATLSFIYTGMSGRPDNTASNEPVRIISDSFPVGNTGEWGRYGCSGRGLVLVTGSRKSLEHSPSGALEELALSDGLRDAKSGALLAAIT